MNKKCIPMYTHNSYPLWLTKSIIIYVKDETFARNIDWLRSTRHCLYVKNMKTATTLNNMHFFYPDGETFDFKYAHDFYDESPDVNIEDESLLPQDFWFEN
ncbi:late expression factor 6 [Erinnyis ello granulovirus]|uniref:Late expression factor 6 n=1 Tax=Erinnyis ello granulovirus TaxID=307444 RepID=A0A097DAM4_9BBAC|nr:late expression factor 6 [Erinnyis ello granulovirus]AIS92071.1 late expression factor 6 [Erinnyis ello granulovirus]ARX71411.1 late expression factor 6 [Erinnyis ello granulovirus]ARX71541.1 late expression factor 6 [Erinnyis ello granulovirus]ARX71671.1 late expression factor 6 [Erinnyis ello granulovirus]ARX71801.1 late expression factor 6 [Erinnyis ello granulovirus]